MKQKRSLSEALQAVSVRQPRPAPAPVVREASLRDTTEAAEPRSFRVVTPARVGKRLVGGHFEKSVSRQLRELAAREDSTVQALLAEAMNMLFAARGLPEIAEP